VEWDGVECGMRCCRVEMTFVSALKNVVAVNAGSLQKHAALIDHKLVRFAGPNKVVCIHITLRRDNWARFVPRDDRTLDR
jgi:hypothetical protein